MPGTTKVNRLEEDLRAVAIDLSPEDLSDINTASSEITVEGGRVSEASERMIDS